MSALSISEKSKAVDASPLALKQTGPITKEGMVFKAFYDEYAYAQLQVNTLQANGATLNELNVAMNLTAEKAKAVAAHLRKTSPQDPSVAFFESLALVNAHCSVANVKAVYAAAKDAASDNKSDK
jgi:hypothetical protein